MSSVIHINVNTFVTKYEEKSAHSFDLSHVHIRTVGMLRKRRLNDLQKLQHILYFARL